MPKRTDLKSILLIGSGPIVIGQACEFDYSGVQACKALKEEGYRVILVNSNPATIMTDPNFADRTYIEPITADFVTRVIERERPDALLPTLGGQTALNVTLELEELGVLDKFNVELIGANGKAIRTAEDRDLFKGAVERCGLFSARSYIAHSLEEAKRAVDKLGGYPFVIRPSRTLGGSGGGIVYGPEEFEVKVNWGFECSPINEVLIEESLVGWKEFELEVMRDKRNNSVIVCSIENLDPMGLHTGDSVTVAPIQTLTDKEYQGLRDAALRIMAEIGVETGGSNVQFAIEPATGRVIVIELNPRVSRSSALASKATGFPIAKIAAKLAIGYTLDELPNDITEKTPACFEPSIDYVVVKIPRFNFEKFPGADQTLGTQMKSVGEVMAIGRSFPEALQKACRSLEVGRNGLLGGPETKLSRAELFEASKGLHPTRLYQIATLLEQGVSPEDLFQHTFYDPWFTREMLRIVEVEAELRSLAKSAGNTVNLQASHGTLILKAKKLGASDLRLGQLLGLSETEVREFRHRSGIRPAFKAVDTCAAEFSSDTPYLYSTYDDASDSPPTDRKKVMILGGGPNRIGQGLEFDYCCVHASMALADAGIESIMVNCNPETVSTDYDTSDRLYFEPLTLEDVLEIVHREQPWGVVVQYGGQTPLRLSTALEACGVPIIGTSPDSIELTEDREKFRDLLIKLNLRQSEGGTARNEKEAVEVSKRIGYPLLVRPSYVLGGRAMVTVHDEVELRKYISESMEVSFDRPVLLDRFLDNAIEIDVDCVCDGKETIVGGIMEHIERAGVHSGDSSFMLPSQTLSAELLTEIESATKALALNCGVRGLMNVQYAVQGGRDLFVIEVNPRASRSVPFVSKVMGIPWAKVATRVMTGETLEQVAATKLYGDVLSFRNYAKAISKINYVAIKQSVFPFAKFKGVDTLLGPEMKSTGEVMGIDRTRAGGVYRAQRAAGFSLPAAGKVFFSIRDGDKVAAEAIARRLTALGFGVVATKGTAKYLSERGIPAEGINKVREGSPHAVDLLLKGEISMVVNTPEGTGTHLDSRSIRSTATELRLPLFTTLAATEAAVEAMEAAKNGAQYEVLSIQEYLAI